MRLYLVQHAEPKRKEEDPSRPLSEKGWEDIRKVAKYAEKHLQIQVEQIVHSGKLRAKQTAEVLAEHLHPVKAVTVAEGLEPLADPKVWKNRLAGTAENIVIVGHLPHLSKLTGHLLTGDESKEVITFRMAGITCLERDESGRWTVRWMITPEIIP
jgi:phosphohistidine phosphatase